MPNQPPTNAIIPSEDQFSDATSAVIAIHNKNRKSSISITSDPNGRYRVRSVLGLIAHRRTSNFRKVHPLGIKSRATFQSLKTVSEENYPEDGHVETTQQQIESCIDLLSSTDVDQNRVGMQRLMFLTKLRMMRNGSTSSDQASFAIIYGGKQGSFQDRLRNIFLSFLYNHDDDNEDNDEDYDYNDDHDDLSCVSSEDSIFSVENKVPGGKYNGALHAFALRVLANALEQIVSLPIIVTAPEFDGIDLSDDIWKQITCTLSEDVEMFHSRDIVVYAMKCLRLLHTIEPNVVLPMLRYNLLPYLVHLRDYGRFQKLPMIESEASRVLRRCEDLGDKQYEATRIEI